MVKSNKDKLTIVRTEDKLDKEFYIQINVQTENNKKVCFLTQNIFYL